METIKSFQFAWFLAVKHVCFVVVFNFSLDA